MHPPDLPGGTRHYDLGRELVKRGHQVVIFASSFHHYLHRETRLQPGERWKIEDVDGVKFVWVRTPPYQRNDWRRVRSMVVFMLRAWWLGRRVPKLVPDGEAGCGDRLLAPSPHAPGGLLGRPALPGALRDGSPGPLAPDDHRYGGTECAPPNHQGSTGPGEVPLPPGGADHHPLAPGP
jgi:hypothetical protein